MRIIQDFVPIENTNRSGIKMIPKYFNIHETDNWSVGANAAMHAKYMKSAGAAARMASWTYTVDSDPDIYQSLPEDEVGWQAGDGRGPGNMESISAEMCVNIDGNYEQTLRNTIWLVRDRVKKNPHLKIRIVRSILRQHWHWSGKNCPRRLRAENRWEWFISECEKIAEVEVINPMSIGEKDTVRIKPGSFYMSGGAVPSSAIGKNYTVAALGHPWNVPGDGARILEINSWVWIKDLELIAKYKPPTTPLEDCQKARKELEAQIATLIKNHQSEITTLKANHQSATNASKAQLDAEKLKSEALEREIDQFALQLIERDKQLRDTEIRLTAAITEMQNNHEKAQEDLKMEISRLRIQLDNLQVEKGNLLKAAEERLSEAMVKAEENLQELKEKHKNELQEAAKGNVTPGQALQIIITAIFEIFKHQK